MDSINIQETEDTPRVVLDANQQKFEISGRSFPEDAAEFYDPVIQWLKDYFKQKSDTGFTFTFRLEYINTASFRQIYKLLLLLREFQEQDHQIKVNWYYKSGDKSMEEAGDRFLRLIDIPINLEAQ